MEWVHNYLTEPLMYWYHVDVLCSHFCVHICRMTMFIASFCSLLFLSWSLLLIFHCLINLQLECATVWQAGLTLTFCGRNILTCIQLLQDHWMHRTTAAVPGECQDLQSVAACSIDSTKFETCAHIHREPKKFATKFLS